MSDDKRSFEHKSLQDAESVVRYLSEIGEGIAGGRLALANGDGEVILEPTGLIKLNIKGSRKKEKGKLTIKLSWKAEEAADEDEDTEASAYEATSESPADA